MPLPFPYSPTKLHRGWRRPALLLALTGALLVAMSFTGGKVEGASSGLTGHLTPASGGSGRSIGDFVSSSDAMDTYYSFFVEVPPNLSRLVVELFDADANDDVEPNGRDRERTNNNSASNFTYRIFDPDGIERPGLLANGTATTPVGADNAWRALYDLTSGNGNFVRDQFGTAAYSNNDGNVNWLTNWSESNDDNSATNTSGRIFVDGGRLNIRDNNPGGASTIQRSASLSGWTNAILTFDFQTSSSVDANDSMRVAVSTDGTSWTTLETFTGPSTMLQTRLYNLKDFITVTANTRIRFIRVNGYTDNNEIFFVDNVQIQDAVVSNGHWEVRIDGSVSSPGDDINAIGIRAHDGNSGEGGTELNVYYDSFTNYGVNNDDADRAYTHHPYVTAGCSLDVNEFDGDGSGSYSVASRSGDFTGNSTGISGNNVWRNQAFTTWRNDYNAADYGIWTLDFTASALPPVPANSGNYYTVYLASSLAANSSTTAPTSQPTPNSFRVYLKTDDGAAPTKPYLEQYVRWAAGANPPSAGQTTRYVITVRMVNPTSRAITFSASNRVIANVPSGVAYIGGSASVTQGSFTAPAGSTGNISWNPSSLAANTTATLVYQVNVTPSGAGNARIPVVGGTTSANATRATFVDETGNTTQARATFTLGPLCELAVTRDILTPAVVSELTAVPSGAGTVVTWKTVSEIGTAGFNLHRLDATGRYRQINERLLPALIAAPQGGVYRFLDRSAPRSGRLTYQVEEVGTGGERRHHGPFVTAPATAKAASAGTLEALDEGGYSRQALEALKAPAEESPVERAKGAVEPNAVKIGIDSPGLYFVSAETIAGQLGLKVTRAKELIATLGFALTNHRGQVIAWMPLEKGAGLAFYGQGTDNPYARDNVYWLRQGRGTAMAGVTLPASGPGQEASTFDSTVHAEIDQLAATVVADNPDVDYWYWSFLVAGDPTDGSKSFAVDAPAAAPLGTGKLKLDLKGASATGVSGEHHALLRVNGNLVGETQWEGIAAHSVELDLGTGIVQAGANTVTVESVLDAGVPWSIFYVDGFDLTYDRHYRAAGDTLAFRGDGNTTVAVEGFADGGISLLDISNRERPRLVQGTSIEAAKEGGFRLTFAPGSAAADYLAVSAAALKAPRSITATGPTSLRTGGAQYLVITTAALKGAAQELANLRTSQGLSAEVVDVADIMDEWNGGISSPYAIRDFLAWRYTRTSPAPRFVVLAGAGSFDYRDNLGLGGNLVPPLMAATGSGLFASDNRFGDVVGNDGVPEIAVGRLPVRTAAELSAYVQKVAAYEAEPAGPWSGRALLLSDDPEDGASFSADSQRLSFSLPRGVTGEAIALGDTPLAAARSALFSALGQGASFLSYVGHGGLDRLAAEGLLTSADVPSLPASARLPVVSALTCIVNRFEVPGFSPLGVELVRQPGRGAVAAFAPTGMSYNAAVQDLGDWFFRGLDAVPGARLGEVANRALRGYAALGSLANLVDIYTLLGDPALLLKEPPAPAIPPTGTGD